jgi:GTP-binding protein
MLIDDVKIKIKAGKGGEGAVAFQHNMMSLGPTGGTGGRGGSIWFEGVSDLGALEYFRYKKNIIAVDGGPGRDQFVDGKDGPDLILKVPVGTIIHNLDTHFDAEIFKVGERILGADGGRGGRGNFHFRSPVNTTPKQFEHGRPGQEFNIELELKLIADVGLIGLPNVGKSSWLNILTKAKSKVANYQFTTLEPYLGVYYGLILADIPGLIEGASSGKGLGIKFLRHVERTKILFHVIAADSTDPVADYHTVRTELGKYNRELLNKTEYVLLNRQDTVDEKTVKAALTKLKKLNKQTITVSVIEDDSIKEVQKILNQIKKEKQSA